MQAFAKPGSAYREGSKTIGPQSRLRTCAACHNLELCVSFVIPIFLDVCESM